MTQQDFGRGPAEGLRARESASEWTRKSQGDRSGASSFVEQATGAVKEAASATAATLAGELKDLLNRQVGSGADKLGGVARSARMAAQDLERDSPAAADLVRTLASRVDAYAQDLRGKSVDEIWQTGTDLARRQPALVFGLAALGGFFALRILKSSPPMAAPSIKPGPQSYQGGGAYGS